MDRFITKDDAISVIRILTDKMADENIDVAAEQFISAIEDLREYEVPPFVAKIKIDDGEE